MNYNLPCDECKRLKERISALHDTLARVTNQTAYSEELEELRQRVSFLMCRIDMLKEERDALKPKWTKAT